MWLDTSSQLLLDAFWATAGEEEGFPRNLERPLALSLPIALVKLPRLRLVSIEAWLRRRKIRFAFGCPSRAVRGCLIAHGGKGLIFVDGTDPDDERRFTLAHEIAHFLTDYWRPRHKAIESLGDQIVDVLDGARRPSITERVHGVLLGTPVGFYQNLMERHPDGASEIDNLWAVETRADRIAMALLAPPDLVLQSLSIVGLNYEKRLNGVIRVLTSQFGLPQPAAEGYGRSLLSAVGQGSSWLESIGLR